MKNWKNIPKKKIRKKIFGVKNSKVANRPKRVFSKFRGDPSEVRGANGRETVVVAAVGAEIAEIPQPANSQKWGLERDVFRGRWLSSLA